jgi:hypothetical protein
MFCFDDFLSSMHEEVDLGYGKLAFDEIQFLVENGVPLNNVDNNFRKRGDLAVNGVVKRTAVAHSDYDEVVTLGVALQNLDLVYADMDETQFDLAEAFFQEGKDNAIFERLFSHENRPPIIRGVREHDKDMSYFEHTLFESGVIPKPFIKLYNPSAGTITRVVKHGYTPSVYVNEEYESTNYFQEKVIGRLEELVGYRYARGSDCEKNDYGNKFLYFKSEEFVLGELKENLYVGTAVWMLKGNSYAYGFEVNPYSHVLEQGVVVSVNGDIDGGFNITYHRGTEICSVKWLKFVDYYRIKSSVFLTMYEKLKSQKNRSDLYQLCVTELDFCKGKDVDIPSVRPIIDPVLIEYNCVQQLNIDYKDNDYLIDMLMLVTPSETKVVDIKGVPFDYFSRVKIIKNDLDLINKFTVKPGLIVRTCISPTLGEFSEVVEKGSEGSWKNYDLVSNLNQRNTFMSRYTANFNDIWSPHMYAPSDILVEDRSFSEG